MTVRSAVGLPEIFDAALFLGHRALRDVQVVGLQDILEFLVLFGPSRRPYLIGQGLPGPGQALQERYCPQNDQYQPCGDGIKILFFVC